MAFSPGNQEREGWMCSSYAALLHPAGGRSHLFNNMDLVKEEAEQKLSKYSSGEGFSWCCSSCSDSRMEWNSWKGPSKTIQSHFVTTSVIAKSMKHPMEASGFSF